MQRCKQFLPLLLYIQEIKISVWSLTVKNLTLLLHDLKEPEVLFLLRSLIPSNFLFSQNNIVFILFTVKRVSVLCPSHGRVFLLLFFSPEFSFLDFNLGLAQWEQVVGRSGPSRGYISWENTRF